MKNNGTELAKNISDFWNYVSTIDKTKSSNIFSVNELNNERLFGVTKVVYFWRRSYLQSLAKNIGKLEQLKKKL